MSDNRFQRVPELIEKLYAIVDEFERLFDGWKFTPDGHLVGSIGEAVASYVYDLEPLKPSKETHDARTRSEPRRDVQVKLTGGKKSVGLRGRPDYLIVLQLVDRKRFEEVYNGPGGPAFDKARYSESSGQHSITLHSLRRLNERVDPSHRLVQVRSLETIFHSTSPSRDTSRAR